jgi:hypothetical protein
MSKAASIEKKAINYLAKILLDTDRIDPKINSDDTQISWDGWLTLLSGDDKLNETDSFVGRIPIQVKGTTINKIRNGTLAYSVSVADLRNYEKDGGCLYFVVYLSGKQSKIFYSQFLPFDLGRILKGVGDQKNKTINFEPFPTDKNNIIELMRLFIVNQTKQISTAKYTFDIRSSDVRTNRDIKNIGFTLTGTAQNPYEYWFDTPTYLYATTPMDVQIPIERFNIIEFTGGIPCNISVNGVEYYNYIRITKSKFSNTLKIGKSITIEIPNHKVNGKADIKFSEKGMLSERIKDNEFLLAIYSNKNSKIICKDIFSGELTNSPAEDNINNIRERINELTDIKNVLYFYGVTADLNMDKHSKEDQNILAILFRASQGEEISITSNEITPISYFTIVNLNILVYLEDLNSGKYKVHNFYKLKDYACTAKNSGKKFSSSPFLALHKQDLVKYSNINYDIIYNSIVSVQITQEYLVQVNTFLLEAICAYDEKKADDSMEFIGKLSRWILSNNVDDFCQLNYLQVEKRKRTLTLEEQRKLRNIVNESEDTILKIGACILLESFSEAKSFWDILTEEEVNFIKSYSCFPIFNLWTEHKPEM